MRICFVSEKEKISGPQTWQRGLINALREKGCDVIQIYTSSLSKISLVRTVKQLQDCDLAHTFSQAPGAIFLSYILSRIKKTPLIHTVHGDYFNEIKSKRGIKRIFWLRANNSMINNANAVTFPSNYLLKKILERRGEIVNKAVVIPNGININEVLKIKPVSKHALGLRDSTFLISQITNFNHVEKARGVTHLIGAFNQFNRKYPESMLFIIGGGRHFMHFKGNYASEAIHFLGAKKRDECLRLIKASDMIVHSTFLDNFPYVLLEAMSCKKPILGTDTGAIPELLRNNGMIINASEKQIFEKLAALYVNPLLRQSLSKKAFRHVQIYAWQNIVQQFIDLYESVTSFKKLPNKDGVKASP